VNYVIKLAIKTKASSNNRGRPCKKPTKRIQNKQQSPNKETDRCKEGS